MAWLVWTPGAGLASIVGTRSVVAVKVIVHVSPVARIRLRLAAGRDEAVAGGGVGVAGLSGMIVHVPSQVVLPGRGSTGRCRFR